VSLPSRCEQKKTPTASFFSRYGACSALISLETFNEPIALLVALGGTTYAASGGNFMLGKANSASSTTSLSAPVSCKRALQLTNHEHWRGGSRLPGVLIQCRLSSTPLTKPH